MGLKTLRNLDIYVPNFDFHINELLKTITPSQMEMIPPELKIKMFKKNNAVIDKLNFTEKLYLLSVCFKQTVIIATQASEGGIDAKSFNSAINAQKGKIKNSQLLADMKIPGIFVQGDRELMRALNYMNQAQCSEIYDLVREANPKNISKREEKHRQFQRAQSNIFRMLAHYEGQKKDVLMNYGLNAPKLYALLYLFSGEKFGKDFYNVDFKHAFTSNRADLAGALLDLHSSGHLNRRGRRNELKYSITAKGIELATKLINKLIYNY